MLILRTTPPLLFLLIFQAVTHAGEFRYVHIEGATGICNFLYDSKGRKIPIEFGKHPNKDADTILNALLDVGIYGTRTPQNDRGCQWNQEIILIGDLSKDWDNTSIANTPAENYREFTLRDIKLSFPFARWVQIRNKQWPVEGPIKLEIHFEIDSLFPDGLKVDGKRIELTNHVRSK